MVAKRGGTGFPGEWGTTRHGRPAGFARHQVLGEEPCDACKEAKAEYDARRAQDAQVKARRAELSRARARALERLRREHPQEFGRILAEEQGKIVSTEVVAYNA